MLNDYLNPNSGIAGHALKIQKVVGDQTLTANDSGSIVLVNPAAATAVTLPTLDDAGPGWYCKIVLTEDTDGSDTGMGAKVNIDFGSGNDLVGMISDYVDGAAGDYAVNNDDFINCSTNSSPGDCIDIFTDGERWYAYGKAKDATEMVFNSVAA